MNIVTLSLDEEWEASGPAREALRKVIMEQAQAAIGAARNNNYRTSWIDVSPVKGTPVEAGVKPCYALLDYTRNSWLFLPLCPNYYRRVDIELTNFYRDTLYADVMLGEDGPFAPLLAVDTVYKVVTSDPKYILYHDEKREGPQFVGILLNRPAIVKAFSVSALKFYSYCFRHGWESPGWGGHSYGGMGTKAPGDAFMELVKAGMAPARALLGTAYTPTGCAGAGHTGFLGNPKFLWIKAFLTGDFKTSGEDLPGSSMNCLNGSSGNGTVIEWCPDEVMTDEMRAARKCIKDGDDDLSFHAEYAAAVKGAKTWAAYCAALNDVFDRCLDLKALDGLDAWNKICPAPPKFKAGDIVRAVRTVPKPHTGYRGGAPDKTQQALLEAGVPIKISGADNRAGVCLSAASHMHTLVPGANMYYFSPWCFEKVKDFKVPELPKAGGTVMFARKDTSFSWKGTLDKLIGTRVRVTDIMPHGTHGFVIRLEGQGIWNFPCGCFDWDSYELPDPRPTKKSTTTTSSSKRKAA